MKEIDLTKFQPLNINNGVEIWDSNEARLREIAETINEIIKFLNSNK